MSKLVENKQFVHIVSEVVALMGITFYFSKKNKKLMSHIEDLAQRIEEQEDILQKHEQVIRKLVDRVNQISTSTRSTSTRSTSTRSASTRSAPTRVMNIGVAPNAPVKTKRSLHVVEESPNRKLSFIPTPSRIEEENSEDEDKDEDKDEDLDAEIEDELKELNTELNLRIDE